MLLCVASARRLKGGEDRPETWADGRLQRTTQLPHPRNLRTQLKIVLNLNLDSTTGSRGVLKVVGQRFAKEESDVIGRNNLLDCESLEISANPVLSSLIPINCFFLFQRLLFLAINSFLGMV
jgi:hypothetical protein